MANRIGIRLEDKNRWERRVPLIPTDVAALTAQEIEIWVEPFPSRVFPDDAYAAAGAKLTPDVRSCELLLGIKEMPCDVFRPGGAYMFFSHTTKGQPQNMKMLATLVERECTLLDYEFVTDERGKRLIFFGRHAGLAGMVDTLWALGKRLAVLGHATPFLDLEQARHYADVEAAKGAVAQVGHRLACEGLPEFMTPAVFGFTGYGHVSRGAQEIFDLLPSVEVAPDDLAAYVRENRDRTRLAKVIYKEEHLVEPRDASRPFDLQHYYDHGPLYRSRFGPHLRLLTGLVNAAYWDARYPRLADAGQLEELFSGSEPPRLLVVGDISCDVDGSLACTVRETHPGDPVYVYDPTTRAAPSGFEGPGLAVLAVTNLPTEVPRDASEVFSRALSPFVPALARADLGADLPSAALPDPIRRSAILWHGQFTSRFEYMRSYLRRPTAEPRSKP